jgi:hypothetical protein
MFQGRVAVTLCMLDLEDIGNRYAAQVIPHLRTIERTPLRGCNNSGLIRSDVVPGKCRACNSAIRKMPRKSGRVAVTYRLQRRDINDVGRAAVT